MVRVATVRSLSVCPRLKRVFVKKQVLCLLVSPQCRLEWEGGRGRGREGEGVMVKQGLDPAPTVVLIMC